MHKSVLPLGALAALLGSSTLLAQAKVIPASATWSDAADSSYAPFIYAGGSRTQQLIDAPAITPGVRVIQQIAYRRDATNTNSFAGRQIPNFKVTLGYSSLTAATMSSTFASNRSGNQTVVFQGTYNLPAQPPVTGVGPWNVVFKPAAPFVFVAAQGNLLIEFEEAGQATTKNNYVLDGAMGNAASGSTATFGSNGAFKSQEVYRVVCPNAVALKPGGAATIEASGLAQDYPAAVVFGFSATQYGSLVLPFDLTGVGAPGNNLYASLDVIVPLVLSSGRGSASLPIPNITGIDGFSLFGQALFFHAASNRLGIVWSAGVSMMLSGQQPMQVLLQSDSTSTVGSFMFGAGVTGGTVIQLS